MEAPSGELDLVVFQQTMSEGIAARYEKKVGAGENFFCKQCGAMVMQATCAVSLHAREFGDLCAGSGKVVRVALPYCPQCEGEPTRTTTCVHVPMKLVQNLVIITDRCAISEQSASY